MTWLRGLISALLALVVLFEEWGWEPLQRLMARLGRLPFFAWLERCIARLPPYAALVVFFVPMVALFPVKLGALWLIAHGHALVGAALIVGAKLLGTALVARLFALTKPSLMTLAWFARLYGRWTVWKDAIYLQVRASWPWRASRVIKRRVQRGLARWRGTPS